MKNLPANAGDRGRRHGFNSWVRKFPWRRNWQPTLVFSPAKPRGQRSMAGQWVSKESATTERACTRTHTCTHTYTHTHTHTLKGVGVSGAAFLQAAGEISLICPMF